jgi:hypothetical protein
METPFGSVGKVDKPRRQWVSAGEALPPGGAGSRVSHLARHLTMRSRTTPYGQRRACETRMAPCLIPAGQVLLTSAVGLLRWN